MGSGSEPSEGVQVVEVRQGRGASVVLLDDGSELRIPTSVIASYGIRAGSSVSSGEMADIAESSARVEAHETALRLLSYRMRSEQELRTRLRAKGLPGAVIAEELERLHELGLIDDDAFAAAWVEERGRRAPRSARLLGAELRAKGISTEVASRATDPELDFEAALRVARGRLAKSRETDAAKAWQRVGALLERRGFSREIARSALREAAAEVGIEVESGEG